MINVSTFLIYAALYSTSFYTAVLLQATLGYTATAAALTGFPSGILLVVLSTRVGAAAGRIGPKPFLVIGPLIMAVGMLWWARIPPTSEPWLATLDDLSTLLPPMSVLVDVLPALTLFGLGISLVVAPLTSTLMNSIPTRNAGLGSAINNALSRVGQPLVGALLFIVVSATFYGSLASHAPGINTDDPAVRRAVPAAEPPDRRGAAGAGRGGPGGVSRGVSRRIPGDGRAAARRGGGELLRAPRRPGGAALSVPRRRRRAARRPAA